MKLMKRRAAALLAAACIFCTEASALSAQRAAVLDADTGVLLYEKDADTPGLIASTTKIMTGLLICENCRMDDEVVVPQEAAGIEGSSIYLKAGERVTVEELLYGLMLQSGNDAAIALAIHTAGSVDQFVAMMNRRASALGLRQTHFENPNGLDAPDHHASAADLARLTAAALQNDTFRTVVATKQIRCGARSFTNHNKLLWRYDGAIGVKTGFTKAAGRILVSAAERCGRTVVAVTMNAPDDWRDHAFLLDDAFADYSETDIAVRGERVAQVSALSGGTADVRAGTGFRLGLRGDETVALLVRVPKLLWVLPEDGSPAGELVVLLDGAEMGSIPLYWSVKA